MKILFLHGWTSKPGGVKPTHLANYGHTVFNPALPQDDFDEAMRIAQAELDARQPHVLVGSSRGGAIAMNIQTDGVPLVLLAPAWKRWGKARNVKPGTLILHSPQDAVIPFTDSKKLVASSRLPASSLIVVGYDHSLTDPESLQTMLAAVARQSLSQAA
ncbi:MAG: alpha/beta hydrolase [Methylococcaceae bacterium]|nr:MAG: alpha/beta hydrolase [Methylococcaceae bacterium]